MIKTQRIPQAKREMRSLFASRAKKDGMRVALEEVFFWEEGLEVYKEVPQKAWRCTRRPRISWRRWQIKWTGFSLNTSRKRTRRSMIVSALGRRESAQSSRTCKRSRATGARQAGTRLNQNPVKISKHSKQASIHTYHKKR